MAELIIFSDTIFEFIVQKTIKDIRMLYFHNLKGKS